MTVLTTSSWTVGEFKLDNIKNRGGSCNFRRRLNHLKNLIGAKEVSNTRGYRGLKKTSRIFQTESEGTEEDRFQNCPSTIMERLLEKVNYNTLQGDGRPYSAASRGFSFLSYFFLFLSPVLCSVSLLVFSFGISMIMG